MLLLNHFKEIYILEGKLFNTINMSNPSENLIPQKRELSNSEQNKENDHERIQTVHETSEIPLKDQHLEKKHKEETESEEESENDYKIHKKNKNKNNKEKKHKDKKNKDKKDKTDKKSKDKKNKDKRHKDGKKNKYQDESSEECHSPKIKPKGYADIMQEDDEYSPSEENSDDDVLSSLPDEEEPHGDMDDFDLEDYLRFKQQCDHNVEAPVKIEVKAEKKVEAETLPKIEGTTEKKEETQSSILGKDPTV